MNTHQSNTWELLLLLGIVIVLISPVGDWLAGVVREAATYHSVQLNFFGGPSKSAFNNAATSGSGGGGSSTSSNPSLFNVPIIDASGGVGTIQVVASNAAAALANATQGGNRPTGNATPA